MLFPSALSFLVIMRQGYQLTELEITHCMLPLTLELSLIFTPRRVTIESMNKKKVLIVIVLIIAFIGLLIWNAPRVKSRRLGQQCLVTQGPARDMCLINIATDYNNQQLCDPIEDLSMNKLCLVNVYYSSFNPDSCESQDQRDICLDVVARRMKNSQICSKINDQGIKGLCQQNLESSK